MHHTFFSLLSTGVYEKRESCIFRKLLRNKTIFRFELCERVAWLISKKQLKSVQTTLCLATSSLRAFYIARFFWIYCHFELVQDKCSCSHITVWLLKCKKKIRRLYYKFISSLSGTTKNKKLIWLVRYLLQCLICYYILYKSTLL